MSDDDELFIIGHHHALFIAGQLALAYVDIQQKFLHLCAEVSSTCHHRSAGRERAQRG